MKNLMTSINMDYLWQLDPINCKELTKLASHNLAVYERSKWYKDMWDNKKLEYYRVHKRHYEQAVYTTCLPRHQRSTLAMLRCGSLPLMMETGRWTKPKTPVEQRVCPICPDQIESELHFMFDCSLYDDLRSRLVTHALRVIPGYGGLLPLGKYACIMECVDNDFNRALGNIIYKMNTRRQSHTKK
jgi:hypothetical protein